MKFKPLLGSDLSGHLGGIVASHNTYGGYFRQRVSPVNPRTPAQYAQRTALSAISQTWRALDPGLQAAWAAACITKTSRSGDTVCLSGQAAFVFVNVIRKRIGLSLISSPPSGTGVPALTLPTVTFNAADNVTVTFNAADEWNEADGGVIASGGLIVSPGVTYARAKNAVSTAIFPGASPATWDLPWAVPIGGTALLEFHASNPDGRVSGYGQVRTVNSSYPPPAPPSVSVLSVTKVGTKIFLWSFNGPITVTPGADPNLAIATDTTGVAAVAGPTSALVTYTTANATGLAWSVIVQPDTITESVVLPESGLTV